MKSIESIRISLIVRAVVVFQVMFAALRADAQPPTAMYDILVEYQEDRAVLNRFYFVSYSPERITRMRTFYTGYLNRLELLPFESMSTGGKVDWLLFRNVLHEELRELDEQEEIAKHIMPFIRPGFPIYELEQKRRRGLWMDGSVVAEQMAAMEKSFQSQADDLRKKSARLPPRHATQASNTIARQRVALESVFEFYSDYDPEFTWWVSTPIKRLDSIMAGYARLLKFQVDSSKLQPRDASGIFGEPIGREALIDELMAEMIPYTPEELLRIADEQFAWCDREMLKASAEMGFGDDWKAALEKVKQSYVPPGHQPEAMLDLYNQSVEFLKANDLLTIPPLAEEVWRMSMIPPERQRISPFFLGGEVLQISYPTDDMTHEEKMMSMRGNNPHFSRATVHHELIAGHHLQRFMNERNHPYRFYSTPFWTEGWALYWEMILYDLGFPRSAEDRVGMLFWRMHRCARIIFSIKYHQGEWTPQQCIDFLVDRVGHERANAEGEVRRSVEGGYGPLYQLAYMIGGQQFYALKKELVDSGRMTYKEFHDAVLQENSMPVEMVRAILTDQSLDREFRSQWRFYSLK